MFLYTVIEAIVGVVAGIVLAACTKKAEDATYTKLDKAGLITNILLMLVYLCLSPLFLFLGSLARTHYDGFLGVIGWIVAILSASAVLPCGVGLGLSVMLRKKGKSKQSFAVQFAGLGGMALSFILFVIFYGNLLAPLN